MRIGLQLYETDEAVFYSIPTNYINFPVENPQECNRIIFKNLLNDLKLMGILSYPHENKLYFVSLTSRRDLIGKFYEQIRDFIRRYSRCFSEDKKIWQEQENPIVMDSLRPVELKKDFNIIRFILYRYLGSVYGYGKGVIARGSLMYIERFPPKEGEYMFGDKLIRRGINVLFEVTGKGRGRLWFDIVTHAFIIDENGAERRLSHYQMKQESLEFYNEYLSLARMKPRDRYNKLTEMLSKLGIQSRIEVGYYVWDGNNGQFREQRVVFTRVGVSAT